MRQLYPACPLLSSEHLNLGGGHSVYVEQCGSPDGIPVVFLHGGPGSGCKPDHRQFFDPARYRVILFDQRGSGRSTPYGGVENNTTAHLIDDMEAIRKHFSIPQWALFGGSWGATLALAYAEALPQRVIGMVLRGSFLARPKDVQWFFSAGANRLLPQAWQRFVEALDIKHDGDLTSYLHDGVFSSDENTVKRFAAAWEAWSGAVVMFSIDPAGDAAASTSPSTSNTAALTASDSAIAKARVEMHYARHDYFMERNQLLLNADKLPSVPMHIVHGARDLTCPAEAAWTLHQAVPHSTLEILRTAGHLSSERPMIDALVRASDQLALQLAGR